MIEYKCTHSGQYRAYGDSYRVYQIKTDMSMEEVVEWVFNNLHSRRVPSKSEWQKNLKDNDLGYFFAGYYTIIPITGGFEMTFCEPYTD